MKSSRRLLLPAASTLALLMGAGMPVMAVADTVTVEQAATVSKARPWPHDVSDLKPDSRIRYGTLPNGMRYALLRNATPPGLTSLRIHFNAGSLNEDDDQKGLAHFTEHMLFNGTENIPETEMLRILERLGLAFGADTNAATSFDQTFYRLDLPRSTDDVLDPSLRILREQVSRALFDKDAIEAERDVIVGEERSSDTPGLRALKAQINLLAPGQRLSERLPIGDLNIIRTAPAQRFIDFYRAYYRPERATFVAVGDFDIDTMEAKVTQAFGDWVNEHPNGPDPDLGTTKVREPQAVIHVEPGTSHSINVGWLRPADNNTDSVEQRRKDTLKGLAFSVLNRRYAEISRQDNPPFRAAGAESSDVFRSVHTAGITVAFNPDGLERALSSAEQELRRMVEYGPTEAEIQREITDNRTALENALSADNTQQTAALASGILGATNSDTVWTSAQDDLDLFNQAVANINLEEVHQLFVDAMKGSGPVAMVTTPTPIENGEALVLQTLAASQQVKVDPPVAQAAGEWPYSEFGTATVPAQTQQLALVEATQYTFPNNVRLIVKPTDFTDNQVLVSVQTGIGHQGIPSNRFDPLLLSDNIATAGGLGKLTMDELTRVLSGRVYSASFGISTDSVNMSGVTRPADLDLQLQVLAAYFTDPAFRSAPLEQLKTFFPQLLQQVRATPNGVVSVELPKLLTGGDVRSTLPSNETIQAITAEQVKAATLKSLAEGPIDIVIVGDVKVEDAIAAVSKTFGALPTRSPLPQADPEALAPKLPDPTPTPFVFTHDGPANQSIAAVFFPGTDNLGDRREARLVSLAREVISLRSLDEIREKQALSYSPSVNSVSSGEYEGYGYISFSASVDTAKVDDYFAAVEKVATDFVANPVSDDEITRARTPVLERHQRSRATNGYWTGALIDLPRNPEYEVLVSNYAETINSFTAEDVQAAILKYLRMDRSFRVKVIPASAQ